MKIRIIKENYGSYSMGTKSAPSAEDMAAVRSLVAKIEAVASRTVKEDPLLIIQIMASLAGFFPLIGNLADIFAAAIAAFRWKAQGIDTARDEMILSLLAALPILGYTGGAVGLSKMAGLKGPKLSRAAKAAFIRSTGIKTSKQAKEEISGAVKQSWQTMEKILKEAGVSNRTILWANKRWELIDFGFQIAIGVIYFAAAPDEEQDQARPNMDDLLTPDAVFGFTMDKSQKAQKSPQKQEVPPKQYTKVMP